MSSRVSRSFPPPSPPKVDDEVPKLMEKQGIVSILRSDSEHTKTASLRRTLSADMSSRKWLAQNGFSPMKKIASSAQLPILTIDSSSSSEGEDEYEGKREKAGQLDVWSSILSQKAKDEASNIPAPYIHPLVKRASSLSEKSLQVCTEALGSETGSDGFSSYPSSESGDGDEDKQVEIIPQQQQQTQVFEKEETQFVKINTNKKVVSRSFPPPLPSLTRGDGPSLHMHSHRQNGRLVLEAVSMPSTNFFHAQRHNGRLLLTLFKTPPEHLPIIDDQVEDKLQEYKGIFEIFENEEENIGDKETYEDEDEDEDEDGEGEEDEEMSIVIDKEPKMTSGVINLHRAALTVKKLMGIENRNPVWPHKFNKEPKMVEMEMEVEVEMEKEKDKKMTTTIPQSLPPLQRVAGLIPTPPPAAVAANSFNAYEYFWRAKPAVASLTNHQIQPLENKLSINNPKAYRQQDMVNKTLVPSWRGCKENRRTVLIWEPYCVATS